VEALNKGKVTEEVGAELKFETLGRFFQLRHRHDAGVVDQDVKGGGPFGGKLFYGPQVRKIEVPGLDCLIAGGPAKPVDYSGGGLHSADGKRDLRSHTGKRAGGLNANSGGAPRDDRASTGKVEILDDFRGGRGETKRGGEAIHG
jgi:hypothetical protein